MLSHSGLKQYSAKALEMAKAAGAKTANVTSLESEAKADLADVVIRTSIRDKSAAFTISHTGAMTVLAMLAAEVGVRAGRTEAKTLQSDLGDLPKLVEVTAAEITRLDEVNT